MDFTLHQLRIFQAVARHGSYSRAAEALFISQPGVSQQIKSLEASVGMPLFDRLGRRVHLTEAGETLLTYADRVLTLLDEAEGLLRDLGDLNRGTVKVAASTTAGIYVVPAALGAFHKRYPGMQLSLDVLNRYMVLQRLLGRQVDFAIMGLIEDADGLEVERFLPNELVVIASPRLPRAGQRRIPPAQLGEETILIREEGSGTRSDTESLFARLGAPLHVGMELRSMGAIKQAVTADLGIAVMPQAAIALELALGRLVVLDVEGFPVRRDWSLVRQANRRPSRAAAALWDFLIEYRDTYSGSPT